MSQFVVVSYDVVDNRRRIKIMKTLKNFGTHVQYSLFECRLEAGQLRDLRNRLKKLLTKQDSLRIYLLCEADVQRVEVSGTGRIAEDAAFYLC